MNVKINNKNYTVPELGFGHYMEMEVQGFSVIDAFQKKQMLLIVMGFVCIVAKVDKDDAAQLIEQHIHGGGNIVDIFNVFVKAAQESDFFLKMLGQNMEEASPKKTKTAKPKA